MASRCWVFHRGTRLRAPKRPLSDEVKLEYVKWFAIEHQPDWEYGEADIVLHLYLFEGLDKAFEEAHRLYENRKAREMDELLAVFMNPGERSVEDHVLRVEDADLLKDDPSIRDLFGGPNWRTRVAEYFGFR